MAEGLRYVCSSCGRNVEAWSDGNPYYIDERGRKQYAHHPDHERLDRCIGNDTPHLCLACAHRFVVDSRAPIAHCPKCQSTEIADEFDLGGRRCPWCKAGVFARNPNFDAIS